MSKSVFQYYLAHPDIEWTRTFCALPPLSDSFFSEFYSRKATCLWRWWGGNWLLAFLLFWSKAKSEGQGVFSDWLPVYCGVPQGSLLRLLLFNVFINDLNFSVQLSSLRLYADDTTAYASNTDISALELSLDKDLENLSSWFASNYLSVNNKKPKLWSWVSTLMNLLFILATPLSK